MRVAGRAGTAFPGAHNLVGAARLGAAELPQGLGREQRECLAKQQQHKMQRKEEASQDNCWFDHYITYDLRARVAERQQKDAANDRKRAQRNARRLAAMDRPAPWSKFKGKKACVDIENRVDGDVPVVSRHMAQHGIEVLGWEFGPKQMYMWFQT